MSYETILYDRTTLYNEVWKEPVTPVRAAPEVSRDTPKPLRHALRSMPAIAQASQSTGCQGDVRLF